MFLAVAVATIGDREFREIHSRLAESNFEIKEKSGREAHRRRPDRFISVAVLLPTLEYERVGPRTIRTKQILVNMQMTGDNPDLWRPR